MSSSRLKVSDEVAANVIVIIKFTIEFTIMLRRRKSTPLLFGCCILTFVTLLYLTNLDSIGQRAAFHSSKSRTQSNHRAIPVDDQGNIDTSTIKLIPKHERVNLHLGLTKEEASDPNDNVIQPQYHEVFSVSTADKKYFNLGFGTLEAFDPSIIPHPDTAKTDTWVMVAQLNRSTELNTVWSTQLICEARFREDGIHCIQEPMVMPLASTQSKQCEAQHGFRKLNAGTHNGRIFYGPDGPVIMYGFNSQNGCWGVWMQDLRMLSGWDLPVLDQEKYRFATELQRSASQHQIEKDWVIFWDATDQMHVQYQA